jgi:hypothetical protein
VLFAVILIEFLARGPWRALRSGHDLAPPYAATKAWLAGTNPYEPAVLRDVLLRSGRERDTQGNPEFTPSLYPPPTFVALAPLAAFSWRAARLVFLVMSLALFVWHVRSLLELARLDWRDTAGAALLIAVVALAPYHTGIALGQLAIPSIALAVIALAHAHRGAERAAGGYLAVATLLKPQIAGPFIVYCWLRGRRRTALIATTACAAATIVGVGWLWLHDVPWVATWRETTGLTREPGGPLDPAGPLSAQLVDLQPLLAAAGVTAPAIAALVLGAAAAVALYLLSRRVPARHDLLLLAALAVVTLLPVYHRFYDAGLVCLPVAWLCATLARQGHDRGPALLAAACCAVFLAPGAWMLQRLADQGDVSASLVRSSVWNAVLLRHQNWALVALLVVLALAVHRARTDARVATS